jgi:hypothetical protein
MPDRDGVDLLLDPGQGFACRLGRRQDARNALGKIPGGLWNRAGGQGAGDRRLGSGDFILAF